MNRPLVVGYKGEIGSFILNGLLRIMPKALDIWCIDVNETEAEVVERVERSDVIFLCMPIEMTTDWINKYRDLMGNKILIEQCSLKEWVYEDWRKISDLVDIRSMHILFRPSQTPNLEDRKVGLLEGQFDEDMVRDIEKITQSEIVWYKDVKDHDKEMAIQQALVHRTLLILGEFLEECNGSTYVSKKVVELSDRIKLGNKDIYRLIQDNRYLPDHLVELKEKFEGFEIEKYIK